MPRTMNTDGSWGEGNRYPTYCGPAVVSSVLGITRDEAARRLRKAHPRNGKNGMTSYVPELAKVLAADVKIPVLPRTEWGMTSASTLPTFARWMREHPKGEYVLRLSEHYVHVRDGKIIEDNNNHKRRGRVTHEIIIREGERVVNKGRDEQDTSDIDLETLKGGHESLFAFRGVQAPQGNIHRCRCCGEVIYGNAASHSHGMKHVRAGEAFRVPADNLWGYHGAERFVIKTETPTFRA